MLLPRSSLAEAAILSSILFPSLIAAVGNIDCSHVRVDKQSFDLSALSGPHSVMESHQHSVSTINTTYTLDLCKPLKRSADIPKGQECPAGTRGEPSRLRMKGVFK
jgi:hypothetical protein